MDINTLLKERQETLQRQVERINALAEERQNLFNEALRVEGEIRMLKQLEAETCAPMPK
jgi:hypothetical protein